MRSFWNAYKIRFAHLLISPSKNAEEYDDKNFYTHQYCKWKKRTCAAGSGTNGLSTCPGRWILIRPILTGLLEVTDIERPSTNPGRWFAPYRPVLTVHVCRAGDVCLI